MQFTTVKTENKWNKQQKENPLLKPKVDQNSAIPVKTRLKFDR